jgi:hypothetical protein
VSRDPFRGAPANVEADEEARALLVVTPPTVRDSEDAAEVEACAGLLIDLDGGGIFLASSNFRLLPGDSACSGSFLSSSTHFLLPLGFAFARIGVGGTVLGGWAVFKSKSQSIMYKRMPEPLTYHLL